MEEIQITYEAQDLIAAARLRRRRSVWFLFMWLLIGLSSCAAVIMLVLGNLALVLWFMLVPAAYAYQYYVYYPKWARVTMRTAPFQSPIKLRFDEHCIETESATGGGKTTWLWKTLDSSKVLLLFMGVNVYMIVPRRLCLDNAQFERLHTLGKRLMNTGAQSHDTPNPSEKTERNA